MIDCVKPKVKSRWHHYSIYCRAPLGVFRIGSGLNEHESSPDGLAGHLLSLMRPRRSCVVDLRRKTKNLRRFVTFVKITTTLIEHVK